LPRCLHPILPQAARLRKARKKEKSGLNGPPWLFCSLLGETRIQKFQQFVDRLLLVGPAGDDSDLRAAHNPQGQNAQKALGVHPALVFFNPDGGLKLVGFLNEKSRGPGVKANLILNHNVFNVHKLSPTHKFNTIHVSFVTYYITKLVRVNDYGLAAGSFFDNSL